MKRDRIPPFVLAVVMLLSMLVNPLNAGAQTTASGTGSSGSLQAMGFDPTQPSRTDPNGNSIDTKTQNPFGAPSKTLVDSMSIAVAGTNWNGGSTPNFELHDDTMSYWALQGKEPFMTEDSSRVHNSAGTAYDWRTLPKVMAAADINGATVYQQVLTAVLVPDANGTTYGLQLVIEDYNAGAKPNTPGNYIIPLIPDGITMPNLTRAAYAQPNNSIWGGQSTQGSYEAQDYKSHLQMVACRGRVAILVNQTLYDYALTYSGNGYTATLERSMTFDSNNSLAPIAAGDTPMIDLKAGDVNNDGLQDLVITVSSARGTKGTNLLVYQWEQDQSTNFSQPMYALGPASVSASAAGSGNPTTSPGIDFNAIGQALAKAGPALPLFTMKDAAVAVGNVTGSGPAVLVSGYTGNNVFIFMYVTYDPRTGKFIASPPTLETGKSMPALAGQDVPDLACVSLGAPNPGEPQYVFYDGWIFQYDRNAPQNAQNFALIFHDSQNYCTDVYGPHFYPMIFFDTAAGNLSHSNSNQPGAQQLAVLTEDSHFGDRVNVWWYSMNNGKIQLTKGADITAFQYPALSGAVVKGTCYSLKYVSYTFALSDPKVIAVLGASPYYQELQSAYGNGWGNEATTYGTSTTQEQEQSQAVNMSVGATIGFDYEVSAGVVVEEKVAEFEGEVNVTDEFTWGWSKSTSVTVGKSFSAVGDDMVVVTAIPYDIYKYQVSDPGQPDNGGYVTLAVPYTPQLSLMNLDDYNKAVATMNQGGKTVATAVPPSVLDHAVGDPRTYPSSISNFTDIVSGSVVTAGQFVGVGFGNGLAEESITSGTTNSKSFEAAINVDASFTATIGNFVAGVNAGAGYDCGVTTSLGQDTEISGSVVNLPSADKQYNFSWELVGYKAELATGEQCYVVNYLVKPEGAIPPLQPDNLQLTTYTGTSATIGWDSEKNVSKYLIYRSTSRNVDMTNSYATVVPQAGANNQPQSPTYTDNNLSRNQQYYYEVVAEADNQGAIADSPPSATLAVPELITGFAIKTQPRLDYNEGDTLDLSALALTATMADNSTADLSFNDLLQRGMNFSIPDGTVLSSTDNGRSIYITDPMTQDVVTTDPLQITPVSLYSLVTTTSFTVGSTANATTLTPNEALMAHFGITNNQGSPQSVIAVVALFDPNGTMTNVAYSSQTIAAGATVNFDEGGFTLPSPVTGYVAKAFVLEGIQFSTSSLRLLSSVAQIGS